MRDKIKLLPVLLGLIGCAGTADIPTDRGATDAFYTLGTQSNRHRFWQIGIIKYLDNRARFTANDLEQQRAALETLRDDIATAGGRCDIIAGDVSTPESVTRRTSPPLTWALETTPVAIASSEPT